MSEIIRETENYVLVVDQNPFDELGNISYLIKNRETGVVEIDTRIRAEAHKLILELEAAYKAVLAYEDRQSKPESDIVHIKKSIRSIN